MKREVTYESIEEVDESFVDEMKEDKFNLKQPFLIKFMPLLACLVLVGAAFLGLSLPSDKNSNQVLIGGIAREYKGITVSWPESINDESAANYLVGTITEVTNDHIIVDDSVLCSDVNDSIAFNVLTSCLMEDADPQIFKVGNVVVVYFNGAVDIEAGNVVEDAKSIGLVSFY